MKRKVTTKNTGIKKIKIITLKPIGKWTLSY